MQCILLTLYGISLYNSITDFNDLEDAMIKVDDNTVKFEGYELENLIVLLEQVVKNSIIDPDSREFAISFLKAFRTCFDIK